MTVCDRNVGSDSVQAAGADATDAVDRIERDVVEQLGALTDALAAFKAILAEHTEAAPYQMDMVLQRVCEQAVAAIPSVGMASITLIEDNEAITVACTDVRARNIDSDQYRSGQGPCLHAAATGETILATSDDIGRIWPLFARAARELNGCSMLSTPLAVDDEHAGSLNLYSTAALGFADVDTAMVGVYVAAISTAVWNARRVQRALDEIGGLNTAMVNRAVIEQAKGILMKSYDIPADAAFAKLVVQSQQKNIKLSAVARLLTEGDSAVAFS